MRTPPFYQAFIVCLQTVERNDPTLLLDIDPKLVIEKIFSSEGAD